MKLIVATTAAALLALTGESRAEVLHLADGTQVVGSIESKADAPEIKVRTRDGLVSVDRAELLTIEEGARLRKLIAIQRRKAGDDWRELLKLSDWAVRKGMFEEALDLADRARLTAARQGEPELAPLPSSLGDIPVRGVGRADELDDKSAWRLLLTTKSKKTPARAELAAARLDQLAGEPDVTPTLIRGLYDPNATVRKTSLAVLASHVPEGTIEKVIHKMLFDRDASVRHAATDAVRAYENDGVILPLVRALQQEDPALRSAAMDAIEWLEDPRAIGALIKNLRRAGPTAIRNHISITNQYSYVGDFDTEIAQAAVIAQPIVDVIHSGSVLDVGIQGLYSLEIPTSERSRVFGLLSRLSGVDFGEDTQAWVDWYQRQRQARRPVPESEQGG